MAKHTGRGFSTIEYPTGMNQNGDPSQAWIKLKRFEEPSDIVCHRFVHIFDVDFANRPVQ